MVRAQRIAPALLMQAAHAGVEIVCGTNAAFMAGDVPRECLELHRAGLSAAESLQAATRSSGRALKPWAECGAFQPGQLADMVFLRRTPLRDLHALREVSVVMIGGEVRFKQGGGQ
jgi:imidazolonepropionase-like amidohydrolase